MTTARPGPGGQPLLRVMGIDPGTATTGFGLIEGLPGASGHISLVDYGVIRTLPTTSMPDRLVELYTHLTQLIEELRPDAVAVEELFFSANVTTAISVGQARGVILLAAAQAHCEVAEYTPMEVKLALTGYGKADKRQVQDMLRLTLGLDAIPRPDDAADAVAIAVCHLQVARRHEAV